MHTFRLCTAFLAIRPCDLCTYHRCIDGSHMLQTHTFLAHVQTLCIVVIPVLATTVFLGRKFHSFHEENFHTILCRITAAA